MRHEPNRWLVRVGQLLCSDPTDITQAVVAVEDGDVLKQAVDRLIGMLKKVRPSSRTRTSSVCYSSMDMKVARGLAKNVHTGPALEAMYRVVKSLVWCSTWKSQARVDGHPSVICILQHLLVNPGFSQQFLADLVGQNKHTWMRSWLSQNPNLPPSALQWLSRSASYNIRANVASHPNTPTDTLARLAQSRVSYIQTKLASNPSATPPILDMLYNNPYINSKAVTYLADRADYWDSGGTSLAKHFIDAALGMSKGPQSDSRTMEIAIGVVQSQRWSAEDLAEIATYICEAIQDKTVMSAVSSASVLRGICKHFLQNPGMTIDTASIMLLVSDSQIRSYAADAISRIQYQLKRQSATNGSEVPPDVTDEELAELGSLFTEYLAMGTNYISACSAPGILRSWFQCLTQNMYNFNTPSHKFMLLSLLANPNLPLAVCDNVLVQLLHDLHTAACAKATKAMAIHALICNANCPPAVLEAATDINPVAVASVPTVTLHLIRRLAASKSRSIRMALAANPATPVDLLQELSKSKSAAIRGAAVANLQTKGGCISWD